MLLRFIYAQCKYAARREINEIFIAFVLVFIRNKILKLKFYSETKRKRTANSMQEDNKNDIKSESEGNNFRVVTENKITVNS